MRRGENGKYEKRQMWRCFLCTVAAVLLLSGCGKKEFDCGLCGDLVKESPHKITVLGQELEICNSCFDILKELKG